MRSLKRFARPLLGIALVVFVALVAAGCQSSSPTEPKGSGTPATPKSPTPVTTYNITVSASPSSIALLSTNPSKVTIRVTRSDTGQPPPDLTEVTVSTTLGEFGAVGSGSKSTTVQLVNGQGQVTLFPGSSQGTATIKAVLGTSAGAANVLIGQQDTFFVSSASPGVGSPAGGDTVQISGGGFVQPVRVTFGTAPAEVLSVSPNTIRVRTPTGTAAGANPQVGQSIPVNVQVTINVNQPNSATDTLTNGFTYSLGGSSQPQVFSISPASGPNEGGTTVTIVGTGFEQPVQVLFGQGAGAANFNGVEATVQSVTSSRIVLTTPAARGFGQNNVNQLVSVLVKNLNTGFSTVAAGAFKYGSNVLITAMGPGAGSYLGGTKVTIFGQGFEAPVAVSLGGIGQLVLSVTGTEIIIQTVGVPVTTCPPSGVIAATGVQVTNINTGASNTAANLTFSYLVPLPVITGISPNAGSSGVPATISGQNFSTRGVQVLFGDASTGSSATITSVAASGQSIGIIVPPAPPGFSFTTQACTLDPGPPPVAGTQNIPTPISVTVRNLDGTGCVATLSNAFLLSPSDNACH